MMQMGCDLDCADVSVYSHAIDFGVVHVICGFCSCQSEIQMSETPILDWLQFPLPDFDCHAKVRHCDCQYM